MTEPTTTDWDTLIKIWAVLGPLLVGVVSAVWARVTRLNDRKYEQLRENERLDRAKVANRADYARSVQRERHNELKKALSDFMASSHEYLRKQCDYLTDRVPDKHKAASLANDKFGHSCQVVVLLGDVELAESAIRLWNLTISVPKSYDTPMDQAQKEKLKVYQAERASFNAQARAYLESLDGQEA